MMKNNDDEKNVNVVAFFLNNTKLKHNPKKKNLTCLLCS